VRAIGIDLAWGDVNETGVVAVESDGTVVAADWTTGVDETLGWIQSHSEPNTMVMVDAPLVVANPSGQRQCEREVGQRYGRSSVSANSTNLSSPRRAGERLREALEASGWTYSDGVNGPPTHGRVVSECYPYATIVGAHELNYEKRPAYKRRPRGIKAADWPSKRAHACDDLVQRLAGLRGATPAMDLASHRVTAQLINESSPTSNKAYKHREDLIDASIAAWTAALWTQGGFARCQLLGDDDSCLDPDGRRATIIAAARRDQRRYLPVDMPACFVLEFRNSDGTWMDEALRLKPQDFSENGDGSYLYSGGASGLWIRAINISAAGVITHVDGGGDLFRYRLVALPDSSYPGVTCESRDSVFRALR
jgi:predicted RNase H-like nuclease